MKKLFLFVLVIAAFSLFFSSSAEAQTTPEQAGKTFYQWYLGQLNAQREPIRDNKKQMLAKVSQRLGRWLYSNAYEEYGADYLIDAQDFDENWAKNVAVTRVSLHGKKATVKVILSVPKGTASGFSTHTLTVRLVSETGAWKIDSVNNRALTR
jgi:uncharacterized protein YozE (UPF0346 family)